MGFLFYWCGWLVLVCLIGLIEGFDIEIEGLGWVVLFRGEVICYYICYFDYMFII